MTEDASSWKVDDTIAVASTDYDFKQAERFKITAVDGKKVKIRGLVSKYIRLSLYASSVNISRLSAHADYVHFGDEYMGVPMRAEVANLNRNVKVNKTSSR